jgi:hypothetical protein
MRLLLALAGVAAVVGLAVPAHADPDSDFLAALTKAGVSYQSPSQAVAVGRAVCERMDSGMTATDLLSELRSSNPAITPDGAASFTAIAASAYCPQRLTKTGPAPPSGR